MKDFRYDSQSSFSRAFQAFHGCSPSETRTGSKKAKAFPRASLNINLNIGQDISYRIEKTVSSVWFGKSIKIDASEADSEKIFKKVFEFGNEIMGDGTHERIIQNAGMVKGSSLQVFVMNFRKMVPIVLCMVQSYTPKIWMRNMNS